MFMTVIVIVPTCVNVLMLLMTRFMVWVVMGMIVCMIVIMMMAFLAVLVIVVMRMVDS